MAEETRKDGDFQAYLNQWQNLIKENLPLKWHEGWLENGWCAKCRYCCGPQGDDEPFPMALLPDQLGPETPENFYMLNENTACIGPKGCKSETTHGCRLERKQKPIACGLFPVVLINGRLYLYTMCPSVLAIPLARFFEIAKKAAEMLKKFDSKELEHISISMGYRELSEKYVDLHCQVIKAATPQK